MAQSSGSLQFSVSNQQVTKYIYIMVNCGSAMRGIKRYSDRESWVEDGIEGGMYISLRWFQRKALWRGDFQLRPEVGRVSGERERERERKREKERKK